MPTVWAVFSFESTAFYISLYHANVVVGYKGLDRICHSERNEGYYKEFIGHDCKNDIGYVTFGE